MFQSNQPPRCKRRRRMMGFLEPCLLLLLLQGDTHGYHLLNNLHHFGVEPESYDPSMIYRALREMEINGWVTSYDGSDSQGPQRRMYHMTKEGENYLANWIFDLRRSKEEIERIIHLYETEKAAEEG